MLFYRISFSHSRQMTITGLNLVITFISDIGFCFPHKRHLKVTSPGADFFDLVPLLDLASAIETPF
jgi:hypothetical protein